MSVQALKVSDDQPEGVVVVHRRFDGEHLLEGVACWCRPQIVEADSLIDANEIVEELERCDG